MIIMKRNRVLTGVVLLILSMGLLITRQRKREKVIVIAKEKMKYLYPLLEERVKDLKRKLKDIEYVSNSMSREIVSLRTSLRKALPKNNTADTPVLALPNVYSFLPHLVGQPQGLLPQIQVGFSETRKATIAFGIPSIKRQYHSYLVETIGSLLQGLTDDDRDDVVIIVFIGDISKDTAATRVMELEQKFPDAIKEGVLEVIVPRAEFYPDMTNLPITFNDSPDRVKWRTKQNLDFAYLMMYAQSKARFYVQLEDDIVATSSYASTVKAFALQQELNEWFILEFSALGFIGKLFKSSDLPKIVDFILMFHKDKPVDWLLDHILWVKVCSPEKDAKHCTVQKNKLRIRFKPSLFQHVGKESSLKGKRQVLVDKDFKNHPMFQAHLNPKAIVKITFETYQRYTAEAVYLGQSFFWGLTPHAGDVIRFCFKHPIIIEKFRFKSGMMDHPGDILMNASVEALTLEKKDLRDASRNNAVTDPDMNNLQNKESKIKNEYKQEDYIEVGRFTTIGAAAGKMPSDIGQIAELRIRVIEHKNENWVALSEIQIVEQKKR